MNKTYLKRKNAFRFKRFANKSYSAYNSMHKIVSIGVLSFATLTCAAQKEAVAQGKDTIKINQIADKNLDEVVMNLSIKLQRLLQQSPEKRLGGLGHKVFKTFSPTLPQ